MNNKVFRFDSEADWIESLVAAFLKEVEKAAERGQSEFHACLAGGKTPEPLYRALAAAPALAAASADILIHLWVGDEREVPPDSDFRNGKMIGAAFGPGAAASAWIRPPVLHLWPPGSGGVASILYAGKVCKAISQPPVFDLSLLGMGNDGHTAGLFSLEDTRSPLGLVVLTTMAPSAPTRRMTLSAETLGRSRSILIPIRGPEKGLVLDAVLGGATYPISIVAGSAGVFFYLRQ
ncbi:MAG TPA: 6-phosphogluconolactonase [Rectinemataceae bacterium]|nr:6-phosphogluconolactonase [Rectinemataceae bacterium]